MSADEIFAHANRIDPDLEKTLTSHEAPAQMAAFLRRVATLSPEKLKTAEDLIKVIDKEDGKDEGTRAQMMRDFWTSVGRRDIKCE